MAEATLHSDNFPAHELEDLKKEIGLAGAWMRVMTRPRAFFRRVGVGHEAYGHDLLVASREMPDPFLFYMIVVLVRVAATALLSGNMNNVAMMLMNSIGIVVGMGVGFFLSAGVYHLLTKIFGCAHSFEAAKSVVGYAAAPLVFPILGGLGFVVAFITFIYSALLAYFALRHGLRAPASRAVPIVLLVLLLSMAVSIFYSGLQGR